MREKIRQGLGWGVILYLILLPLGQTLRVPVLIERGILGIDLVAAGVGLAGLAAFWWNWRQTPLLGPVAVFGAVAGLSLIFSPFSGKEGWFYWIRLVGYGGFYVVVCNLVRGGKGFRKLLLSGLAWSGGVAAGWGLWQYLVYPDIRPLAIVGWDLHLYRAVGSFLDPAFLGIILVLFLVLLVSGVLQVSNILSGWWGRGVGFLTILVLGLTYSRASWLALVGAGLVMAMLERKWWVLGVILGLVGLGVIFLPRPAGEGVNLERMSTVMARSENWKEGLVLVRRYPVLGVGWGQYLEGAVTVGLEKGEGVGEVHARGNDASLLTVAATTGILGLGAYLWVLFEGGRRGLRLVRKGGKAGKWGEVMLASGVAVLVHSFFANSMFYPAVMGWMGVVLGMSLGRISDG